MIVEIIGSTNSGKTTVINELKTSWKNKFSGGLLVNVGGNYHFDFIALPWFWKFAAKNQAICVLARQSIIENENKYLHRWNLYRNFIKKMGVHEFIQTRRKNRDILWDEGPVHAAHNLFVHSIAEPNLSDVEKFGCLVPLPDLIVYLKTPVDEIVSRMKLRGCHKRANARDNDATVFCEHAVKMFEHLISIDRIKAKTVIVENLEGETQTAVNNILQAINEQSVLLNKNE